MAETQVVSLKTRRWQADAYTLVAERAGMTRNAWVTAWLGFAAGVSSDHPKQGRRIKPPTDIGDRTRETAAQVSVKAPAGAVAAWDRAAALAVLSRQQWALCVLDAACGLSALGEQLGRVRG